MKNNVVKIRFIYIDMLIILFVIYMEINIGVIYLLFYWLK